MKLIINSWLLLAATSASFQCANAFVVPQARSSAARVRPVLYEQPDEVAAKQSHEEIKDYRDKMSFLDANNKNANNKNKNKVS